ncbi:general substrate transporter [Periconia macrospinosa]|uniref:Quinate transporter n=1 Tax=Periconia macrospinosa TaxID=97972 RepID=A0A2V1E0N0_9PLEO|nr:general substrate transporter [Periconia macrospinosa]
MPARHAPAIAMSTPAPKEIYNVYVYLTAMVASMGAFIFGYDLAFIGTTITLKPFNKDFSLTHASQSEKDAFSANIVSLLQAGCFFGSLAVAPLGDKYGRKPSLLIAGVLFVIGSLMQTVSFGHVWAMFLGRAIGGLGVGLASGVVPLYIAELSPPSIRGRLVGIYEISVQTGTCIGFWICYGVQRHMAANSAQWITPFAVQLIPGGLLIIGMFFVPESPRWLAQHKSRSAGLAVLSKLRGLEDDHPYVQEEMTHIMDTINDVFEHTPNGGLIAQWKELAIPSNRRRILVGVFIFIFMQGAGSNAINYFSPRIFKSIGLTGQSTGLYATGIYGIVRLICVIIAMYYVVDKFGRRSMLMGGAVIMLIAMWFIGAYIKIANPGASPKLTAGGYAAVTFIYIFAVGFCFSYAGVPWIYCAEIFPIRIRGLGMALCTATHWLFNFVIARSVPYMVSNIGYGTYFVFATCLTLSIPFVYFFVPETKGLSLEEIDVLFGGSGPSFIDAEALERAEMGEKAEALRVERVQV